MMTFKKEVIMNCFCGNKLKKYEKHCSYECVIRSRTIKINDCWNWSGKINTSGYAQMVMRGNKKKQVLVHRISYEVFKGKIPEGLLVCHSCDNTICVNPDHLWLGTQKDNFHDAMKKKRTVYGGVKGSLSGNAKLNEDKVKEILECLKRKEKIIKIAEKYGVHRQVIYTIKNGTAWKHVA